MAKRGPKHIPPYDGYVGVLADCMTEPGEWFIVAELKARTYAYEVAKKLRSGKWALPEGTSLADWSFEARSYYPTGVSEVFAKYQPEKKADA